jgi:hypothetical protein
MLVDVTLHRTLMPHDVTFRHTRRRYDAAAICHMRYMPHATLPHCPLRHMLMLAATCRYADATCLMRTSAIAACRYMPSKLHPATPVVAIATLRWLTATCLHDAIIAITLYMTCHTPLRLRRRYMRRMRCHMPVRHIFAMLHATCAAYVPRYAITAATPHATCHG